MRMLLPKGMKGPSHGTPNRKRYLKPTRWEKTLKRIFKIKNNKKTSRKVWKLNRSNRSTRRNTGTLGTIRGGLKEGLPQGPVLTGTRMLRSMLESLGTICMQRCMWCHVQRKTRRRFPVLNVTLLVDRSSWLRRLLLHLLLVLLLLLQGYGPK